jgi:hypothetical protein
MSGVGRPKGYRVPPEQRARQSAASKAEFRKRQAKAICPKHKKNMTLEGRVNARGKGWYRCPLLECGWRMQVGNNGELFELVTA